MSAPLAAVRGYLPAEPRQALSALALHGMPPLLGAAAVGALAAANGGYYGGTRGWAALALLWLALLAVLLRAEASVGALGIVLLGAFALFVGWSALSVVWSSSITLSVFDVQKLLVYLGLILAALLVVRGRSVPGLLAGVLGGIAAVCAYALATRLFPERLGSFDPLAGYRLTRPVGYWNALGLFAALGAILAAGFAVRVRALWARASAAASLPLLLTTCFFTFSRGAWAAFALGIVAAFAVDPRRLQLAAGLLALAPWPALALVLADRSHALTSTSGALLSTASHEGHRLAVWVVMLSAGAAAAALAVGLVEARVEVPRILRVGFGTLIFLAFAGLLAGVWERWGSPSSLARRAYDSFRAPPKAVHGNLAGRLLDLSNNNRINLWHAAWREFAHHPFAGTGAGTYQQWWYAHRPLPTHQLDAHGLFQQTLGELGVVGLVLLVAALATPLVAAARARRNPLVPVVTGAYVAFLVHNALDWDWQLTGVGAAGLLCAVALVQTARSRTARLELTVPIRVATAAATLALAVLAFATVMANVPLDAARAAASRGDWTASAADARKARTWAPWSSEPLRLLGEAQLAQGNVGAARLSFRTALGKDTGRWQLWVDLALVTAGREKRGALARAERLNPRDSTIGQLVRKRLIQPAV